MFVAFELQSSHVFEMRNTFPHSLLVDWEDLCFDILLCDVNFSHLKTKNFLAFLTHKVKLFLYSFQIQKKHGYGHRYGRVKRNRYVPSNI